MRSFKKRGIDDPHRREGHGPRRRARAGTHRRRSSGDDGERLEVDLVVVSVGRRPLSDILGLDGTGVEVDERGFVKVDERCRTDRGRACGRSATSSPRRSWPTSASPRPSSVIKDILGEDPVPVDYDRVPWCIYCHPEVAFAGLLRGGGQGGGLRRGHRQAPLRRQRPGADRRRARGPGEGHRREGRRRHAAAGSSACTWWGPWVTEQLGQGYLAVNWEATVDEVGAVHPAPPDAVARLFGEAVMALTGRLHGSRRVTMADVRCPSSVRPSPRARSPSGSRRSATQVAEDEVLFEVSTDKVDSEVPSPAAGVLAEILRARGRDRRRRHRSWPCSSDGPAPAGGDVRGGARRAETPKRTSPRPPRAGGRADEPEAGGGGARGRRGGRAGGSGARGSKTPRRRRQPRAGRPPPTAERTRAAPSAGVGGRRRRAAPALAGRAPPDRRARPRPGQHRGHRAPAGASPASDVLARDRVEAGGRSGTGPPRRRAPAAAALGRQAAAAAGQAAGRGDDGHRRGRSTTSAGAPASTWSAPRRPRPTCSPPIEVDFEGVDRVRRAHRDGVARPRRASASPTCRSSPGPSSTPSRTSRTSTPPSATASWSSTTT